MTRTRPRVAVSSPSFCKSSRLRDELVQVFPEAVFNDKGRHLSSQELIRLFAGADAILVGTERIDKTILEALPELKLVSKYGVGLDNIDQEALKKHNVALGWSGGTNRRSVAEMTLCFMIGLCRNIFFTGIDLKQGVWRKEGGRQLTGKTVGIIGCGYIGSEVVELLAPFGCPILIRDILDKSEFSNHHGAVQVGFEELLEQSDIVSLHVPLTDLTHNMIDQQAIHRMRPTAFLVNTCRGEVVDQGALKNALRDKTIAGAAIDVFVDEPPQDNEFLSMPNLMVSPHIGGNAEEAVLAMGQSAISHLVRFFGLDKNS